MRYSRQREQILSYLRSDYSHPTAEDIYQAINESNEEISLGTVYRNLKQLTDAGLIVRISTSGARDRYDAHTAAHYHIRCRSCGRLFDIPQNLTAEMQSMLEKIGADNIMAEGLCPECRMQFEKTE